MRFNFFRLLRLSFLLSSPHFLGARMVQFNFRNSLRKTPPQKKKRKRGYFSAFPTLKCAPSNTRPVYRGACDVVKRHRLRRVSSSTSATYLLAKNKLKRCCSVKSESLLYDLSAETIFNVTEVCWNENKQINKQATFLKQSIPQLRICIPFSSYQVTTSEIRFVVLTTEMIFYIFFKPRFNYLIPRQITKHIRGRSIVQWLLVTLDE